MPDKKKRIIITLTISISAIILLAAVIRMAATNKSASHVQTQYGHEHSFKSNQLSASLNKIIGAAITWGPAYYSWFGKMAPDFTLTDIDGKQHKLSNYRGKNVMIIFWATWCGPCLMEIPHLISLRNIISEDNLAMLAISNENPALVKRFVANKKINYTVFSANAGNMPAPYNQVRNIPCSFFIDSEGKIKLATEGLLSSSETRAILQAE
jgi:peroxiredoxin